MLHTGKRHPWFSRYKAGFSKEGKLLGVQIEGFSNGGWSLDLSESIMQRYLFHLDNAYYIENLDFVGKITKTTVPSNTAFRGFGGPQGVVVIESILNHGAEALGLDPAKVRKNNFYGDAPKNRTPYDQEVVWEDNRVHRIYDELMESTHYFERRMVIESENEKNPFVKRGIAFQPVKFGISFTAGFLNQAGALVLIYADGTVQLNHGGTEMGQGLHTKMIAVCSHELGVLPGAVRIMKTATDKVPNTSATAASSGSDLNGQAVQHACRQLKQRLRPLAAELLGVMVEEADQLAFMGGYVFDPSQKKRIPFSDLVQQAYMRQISLSSTGFYRTPNIHYDSVRGVGKPFHYFAYGGAVVEVEVSALTGEYRLKKVDILHDVGNSLVPSIDIGQVEGGFVQGFGWLTMEKLIYDENGLLLTHAPSTYKIPAFGDTPRHFKVALLERAGQEGVIHRSKAVGEPPFMLAVGVVTSLRHAIRQFSSEPLVVNLDLPATPEEVLKAIYRQQGRL